MNRFVDTDIWKKPWYRKLTPAEKCAWKYITDNCDNVGVWDADSELAEFCIGESIDWETFAEKTNGNIKILDNGKWWLVDFCSFQHPDLNEQSDSKPIKSYVALLKKHNLWKAYTKGMDTLSKGYIEGYPEGIHTFQGKGKGIGKGKGKEKEQEPTEIWENETVEKSTWFAFEKGYGSFLPDRDKEIDAVHKILHKAESRGDPGIIIPKMMAKFLELKKTDNSKKGFWKYQPFLPSALVSLWDRVWEVAKIDAEEQEEAEDIPF